MLVSKLDDVADVCSVVVDMTKEKRSRIERSERNERDDEYDIRIPKVGSRTSPTTKRNIRNHLPKFTPFTLNANLTLFVNGLAVISISSPSNHSAP
jgi:hypothetical protein